MPRVCSDVPTTLIKYLFKRMRVDETTIQRQGTTHEAMYFAVELPSNMAACSTRGVCRSARVNAQVSQSRRATCEADTYIILTAQLLNMVTLGRVLYFHLRLVAMRVHSYSSQSGFSTLHNSTKPCKRMVQSLHLKICSTVLQTKNRRCARLLFAPNRTRIQPCTQRFTVLNRHRLHDWARTQIRKITRYSYFVLCRTELQCFK